MEYAVEIADLRKTFPGFLLKDVTWKIPQGYISGLIGPNGAGKTTIIKLIMNLLRKDSGSISIFDRDHREAEKEIKSRVGFVYDVPLHYGYLKLRDYKSLVAAFYKRWDEGAFRSLAQDFQLPLNRRIKALSRGMKMKFAIALALSHHADLIIMDEPTSGLDPVFRRELLDTLSSLLQDETKTILFSTHITSDLEGIADYVTFIRDGEIVFSEAKDTLLESWAMVKGGNEQLTPATIGLFQGYRRGRYGFEGIVSDGKEAKRIFKDTAICEKPTLEDIMYFLVEGSGPQGGGEA